MTTAHRAITGIDLHLPGYSQSADPGAVGAGKVWHDTDDDKMYVRNAANTAWVELTGGGAGTPGTGTTTGAPGNTVGHGASGDYSRTDHRHGREAYGTVPTYLEVRASGAGTSAAVAREDHIHGFSSGVPGDSAPGDVATQGSSILVPRLDHKHGRETGITHTINFVIDGGGAVIATGVKGDLVVDFACTITKWTLLADVSGSIVVDIWKKTYANYPPVTGDVITASAKPTITTATKGQSSTLTGWTTAIAVGDVLRFNVNSATTVQRVTLALTVTRT